jgi:beta-phosphoglucomutase
MQYKGVIFDMDGTLIDNMTYHDESWMVFLRSKGFTMTQEEFDLIHKGTATEIFKRLFGSDIDAATIASFAYEKEGLYREMYAPHRKAIDGLIDFLDHLKEHDIKIAMATMSDKHNINYIFEAVDIGSYFDVIVSAEHITNGKPHPEIFLTAANQLGIEKHELLVFEDSKVGITAGLAAGMDTVALLTKFSEEQLADFDLKLCIKSYEGLQLSMI